ncbi:unnamed protein product [Rhizophagus irregularis]|nr:unnamed protein product [Rhizophagus irregularis]
MLLISISLFGALLKSNNENLEKALLVGVSCVAKSEYLSGFNNMQVFSMHNQEYADKFGFTEDEVFIILQYYNKSQVEEVKDWYYSYMALNGRIHLYNPWSINQHSNKDFKNKTITLFQKGVVNVEIMRDTDYNLLSQYYFTMEIQCWRCKFEKELPIMIMESLSYFDVPDDSAETNYHMLMVGILSPVQYHEGCFDVRIVPNTEKVIYPVSILMEYKVYNKNKKNKKKNIDMDCEL